MGMNGESIVSTAEHRAIQLGWDPTRPRSTEGARLLIYSQDGLGLGHLRRTTSIANEFLRVNPDAAVLTVSDSPLGTFFGMTPNHDYVKLPSILKSGPNWHPLSLPMTSHDLLSMRRNMITAVATGFRPDIVLVDHMPHGACGELLATLEALSTRSTKIILGLRDILDGPEVTRRQWESEGAYEAVEQYYDDVLVYGSRDVFDIAEQYQWRASSASRLRYCGYVCAPDNPRNVRRIRSKCLNGSGNTSLVVAMAGGGHDAYPLMDSLLRAMPTVTAQVPCSLLMITGPFMPASLRQDLVTRAQGTPVLVRTSVPDVLGYIAAADVLVGMAGYNTTTEILRSHKPAVLVPRRGPSAEQRIRSGLFAERGWAGMVDPSDLSAAAVAQAVLDQFSTIDGAQNLRASSHRLTHRPKPDFGGLGVAVRHMTSALNEHRLAPSMDWSMDGELDQPFLRTQEQPTRRAAP